MNMDIFIRTILCCLQFLTVLHETYEEPSELNYGYTFNVTSVTECPLNKEEWDAASDRLNCTETQGYHCVPDKYMTSLVEFCYTLGKKFPFHEGNCLELASDGILNHFPCAKTFSCGCPDSFYFSNEIYKYPKCLQINAQLGCFDSDIQCMITKALNQNTNLTKEAEVFNFSTNCQDTNIQLIVTRLSNETTSVNNTYNHTQYQTTYKTTQYERESSGKTYVELIVILALFLIVLMVLVWWVYKRHQKIKKTTGQSHQLGTCTTFEAAEFSSQENSPHLLREEDTKFLCLIDVCREGRESEFHSRTHPHSFNEDLLNKTDAMGWTLLHHAAYGGKLRMFQHLMSYRIIDLRATDIIGRTVLHISAAVKKGEENGGIFEAIVEKDKGLLEVEDKNGLMPFCYAALAGNKSILEKISNYGFDIRKQTKYGETVAHLACIGNSSDVLQMLSKMDEKGNQESLQNTKDQQKIISTKNKMDWNPLQYAAKNGNKNILQFLDEEKVCVFYPTEDLKYSFHTACENGNLEACKYIAGKSKESIYARDKSGRHAGHFAAKSGNVEILKYLETQGLNADGASSQNINILHIACRHGRLAMCEYIAERYPELVTQESKKGWNPALFLGERGGAEEERIEILRHLVTKHNLFVYHVSRAGKSILYNACVNRSYTLCEHLLQTYPGLLTIERSMDPKRAAKDKKINELINRHS
ncbi:ankyrin-3-like isoform X3 [Ostrea edulis]|uniref:ankyrin-3-like isoform X3 n=1 Tax=Ostrea edulis TaxID=37623 RepID=UPI0024AFE40D|nr:ankyrin-3-like isoform X3 [Ostrea edulis]